MTLVVNGKHDTISEGSGPTRTTDNAVPTVAELLAASKAVRIECQS